MANSGKYDAVITLGTVIRGATTHYDYVCNEVAKGVASLSLQTDIPVIFGVLTTETIEQAIERAGTKAGNKGYESAVAAIEMAHLSKQWHKKEAAASFYFFTFSVHLLLIHPLFFLLFVYEAFVLFSIHSLFFASSIIVISFRTSFKSFPSVFNPKCSAFVRKCCSILLLHLFLFRIFGGLNWISTYCF